MRIPSIKFDYRPAALYFLLFTTLVVLVRAAGFPGDLQFWLRWATYSFEHGLGSVYQIKDNNYNPLYHYILFAYGQMMGSLVKMNHYAYYLKDFTLVFDFAGAIVAASLAKDKLRRLVFSFLLLFNIGYLYNTLVWGQVDAIFTFLVFTAALLALRNYPVWSFLFYILALNAKTQAIMFLPPLLLLWFPLWRQSLKVLPISMLAGAILQTLILLPFILGKDPNAVNQIIDININAVDFYPVVSLNAYNIWFLLVDAPYLDQVPDTLMYGAFTYKQWGLLFFFLSAVLALFPLFVQSLRMLRQRQVFTEANAALVMLSFGIIPLIFCYFNTQMHERYWHPAVLFLAAYGFVSRNYLLYVIVSVAYFLNLERILAHLNLKRYNVAVFDARFIAGLFTVAIILAIWGVYRQAQLRKNWQELFYSLKHAK